MNKIECQNCNHGMKRLGYPYQDSIPNICLLDTHYYCDKCNSHIYFKREDNLKAVFFTAKEWEDWIES